MTETQEYALATAISSLRLLAFEFPIRKNEATVLANILEGDLVQPEEHQEYAISSPELVIHPHIIELLTGTDPKWVLDAENLLTLRKYAFVHILGETASGFQFKYMLEKSGMVRHQVMFAPEVKSYIKPGKFYLVLNVAEQKGDRWCFASNIEGSVDAQTKARKLAQYFKLYQANAAEKEVKPQVSKTPALLLRKAVH